jgi:hypothetical protein
MSAMNETSTADALLGANGMSYAMPPALSVATSRRGITNFPQVTTSSNGSQIIYSLNTGDGFIHGPSSYMKLSVTLTKGGAGAGSDEVHLDNIGALFDTVTVSTRSGVEICRVQEFGLYCSKYIRSKYGASKFNRTAAPLRSDSKVQGGAVGAGLTATFNAVLPLALIPCFAEDVLLPPQLMEGLRIRFDIASVATAFRVDGLAVDSFTITSDLMLDSTILSDAFVRRIGEIAAKDGLVLIHKEPFHTIVNTSQASLNFDVKKSASMAVEFQVIPRDGAVASAANNTQQSLPYPFTSMQVQVGSVFYPNQPLLQSGAPTDLGSAETYYYVQNQLRKDFDNHFRFEEFYQVDDNKCSAMFVQGLRDSSDPMSGIVLNNSRALLCNATFHSTAVRRVDAYLVHLRLVRVFQNNSVVRD